MNQFFTIKIDLLNIVKYLLQFNTLIKTDVDGPIMAPTHVARKNHLTTLINRKAIIIESGV